MPGWQRRSTSSPPGSRRSASPGATASHSHFRQGPEFVEVLLAIGSLGAAAAPLNPAYSESEFAFYLEDLQPRALLLLDGELEAARGARGDSIRQIEVTLVPGEAPKLDFDGAPAPAERSSGRPDDTALMLHTSGTTSRPKQVPLRHRNLTASACSIARHYALTPEDVSYCAMPLFHVHGLVASTLAQLAVGGTVVVPRRVAPARFWSQLARARRHLVLGQPDAPPDGARARADERPEGSRLRFARSCSSALAPELLERMEEYLGVPMLEAYGMTEASHEMAANPLPPARRLPGSVGIPTGVEIDLSTRADIGAAGEVGEVVIRGAGRDGRLPRERRGERRGVRGRVVSDRRSGALRRRVPRAHGPAQGDHHPRRREHLPARGRGGAEGASGRARGRQLRDPGRRSTAQLVGAAVVPARETTEAELHRVLPREARRVQGPERHPRRRDDPSDTHREGAAAAAWPLTSARTDALRHPRRGAIGAYMGAALARGGSDVGADRPRRRTSRRCRRTACGCCRREATSKRAARRPTTSRRCATSSRRDRPQGLQHPRARAAPRRAARGRHGRVARAERRSLVVLPVVRGRARGHGRAERRPRRRRLARRSTRGG